jgi:hypothetical protein
MSPSHFLKAHFNIILPSIPGSSKWYPNLMPPSKSCTQLSFSHRCWMPHPSHSPRFDHPQYMVRITHHKAPRYVVFSTPLLPRAS